MGSEPLCDALLAKIEEQAELTVHLIGLIPADRLDWTPPYGGAWPVGKLLSHLLECLAGFCAVLYAVEPERLAHFAALRRLTADGACSPRETSDLISVYRKHIREGFALLTDTRLGKLLPTVFVPEGEPIATLLLGNLEHLINHKHQLFVCLKEMGVAAGTADLYRLRGVTLPPAPCTQ